MRLEAQNLYLAYGQVSALRDLSVDVQGRIIGILGATASGKTSLLQVIAGFLKPSGGEIRIDGEPVSARLRRNMAFVPQEPGGFPFFQRPKETLSLALGLKGIHASDYSDQFLDALGLNEENRSASGYSTGMKQKVRIAYAMIHKPQMLLLDEPMTGLDVFERFRVLRLLDRLRDFVSILFSTHHPEEAASVCDGILILNQGRAVAWGNPSELTARAAGCVFEASIPLQRLPLETEWLIVSAERDERYLHVRTVGRSPPNARPVPPRLTDAYVLLTSEHPDNAAKVLS